MPHLLLGQESAKANFVLNRSFKNYWYVPVVLSPSTNPLCDARFAGSPFPEKPHSDGPFGWQVDERVINLACKC